MATFRLEYKAPDDRHWQREPTTVSTEAEAIKGVRRIIDLFSQDPHNDGMWVQAVRSSTLLPDKVVYSKIVRV